MYCYPTFSPIKFFNEIVLILNNLVRYSGIWKDIKESGKILRNLERYQGICKDIHKYERNLMFLERC